MAWNDKPTKAQLFAIDRFMMGIISTQIRLLAIKYLECAKTRKEVSIELWRLRDLYIDRKLNEYNVFDSKIWSDFDCSDDNIIGGRNGGD